MVCGLDSELENDRKRAKLAMEARSFLMTLRMSSMSEIAEDSNLDAEQIMTNRINILLEKAREKNDFDNIEIFEQSLKILPSFCIGE